MSDYLTLLNLNTPPRIGATSDLQGIPISDLARVEQILLGGVRTHSGQLVTPDKARRCSAVLACMRGISEDISALPIRLLKNTPNGPEDVTDHNMYGLLNYAPNDLMTAMELREHVIFDAMLHGGWFVLKNEDPGAYGDTASLWPLHAGYVTRFSQQAFWSFSDPLTGKSGNFTADTVWRGTIMSNNCLDGTALTLLAREAIGLLLAAEEQGARLFSYGVQSDLQIVTEDTLGAEERAQFREAFMSRHSGSHNAFMPFISEGGAKLERIGLTAQESQYIEARKFQIEDIARIFRYPEVLLGNSTSGKSSTYASAEQFFQSYTKHTLGPWAVRFEQTMQRDLLTGKDKQKYFFKHDFSPLWLPDTAARYASYNTAILSGWMKPSEPRKKEGFPYESGLDYFVTVGGTASAPDGGDASTVKPTDQSALAERVAAFILEKEYKALVGNKQDADIFYTHFGGFLEDITGASAADVTNYLELRRTSSDRFTPEAKTVAIAAILLLCKKDK